jgi:glutamyl-tRNA reductase
MSSLAVATSVKLGAASVTVANRTRANAERLADRYGARVIALSDLGAGISAADIVVTCTGALGHVVSAPMVAPASESRRAAVGKPAARSSGRDADDGEADDLVFLDLALPRDVDPVVAAIPGVRLIDLAAIAAPTEPGKPPHARAAPLASADDIVAVRRIVAQELSSFRKADQAASVAPTVVALRAKAATVVDAELVRLERRLGDLDPRTRQEIAKSMGRIADKLLHGPTVRVKELAGSPGAESYETALAVLFGLDQEAVQSVGRPDDDMLTWPTQEE